jgi:general secretion pathway protein A
LPQHCAVAYIYNPKLSVAELLQTVCTEFGIALPAEAASVKAHVDALNRFLLEAHAQGRQALLVIDEAQSLPAEVLEQLRLLTNLETSERKLLQIVLIGQPELRTMLAQPGLTQLAQRVIARYHLGALGPEETRQYVVHRLAVAGPNVPVPFDDAALESIHRLTGGVPRRINLLAGRALLGAYAQGRHRVDRRTVEQAAREVFDAPSARPRIWPGSPVAAVGLAALGAVAVLAIWVGLRPGAVAPTAAAASAQLRAASAASAQAAASAVPVAPKAPAPLAAKPADDPAAVLAAAHADEATAWRELALRWNLAIGEGDPCRAAAQALLACFRSPAGGLPVARLLARPALLTLHAPDAGPVHALLVALDARQATLQVAASRFDLTLPALASVWGGGYATFWRTPPGWKGAGDAAAVPQTRAWIEQQLGIAMPGLTSGTLRERVATFQLVQGLPTDGRAGPMTLMQLGRAAGLDEPRLETER